MKLSIITVNLNNRKGLEETLKSIFNRQSFSDFEQIVIDGGSTDGSLDTIQAYSDRLAYWVSEPDTGIYNAMNKGVQHTTGEYVIFINSGDVLCDDILAKVFANLPDADILYGDLFFRDATGSTTQWISPSDNCITPAFFATTSLPHGGAFIRTDWQRKHPYQESYRIIADRVFFHEACTNGARFIKTKLFISIFNRGGISNNPTSAPLRRQEEIRFSQEAFGSEAVPFIQNSIVLGQLLGMPPEMSPLDEKSTPLARRWLALFYFLNKTPLLRILPLLVSKIFVSLERKRGRRAAKLS